MKTQVTRSAYSNEKNKELRLEEPEGVRQGKMETVKGQIVQELVSEWDEKGKMIVIPSTIQLLPRQYNDEKRRERCRKSCTAVHSEGNRRKTRR